MKIVVIGETLDATREVAGPEQFRLDELIRTGLAARDDPREVIADPEATYFGAHLSDSELIQGADATRFGTRFEDWLLA